MIRTTEPQMLSNMCICIQIMNKTRNILFSFVVLGLCTILFALLMLVSCSGNGVTQPKRLQFTPAEQQLVQDCNDLSFNLLAQTASDEQQENIILSPLSAGSLSLKTS